MSSSEFCVNWSRLYLLNMCFAKVTASNAKHNHKAIELYFEVIGNTISWVIYFNNIIFILKQNIYFFSIKPIQKLHFFIIMKNIVPEPQSST